jgi:hypothetical protein
VEDPFTQDGHERGLHFVALNADIERQFEFIQQTWLNNPVFDGLNGEIDPLVGGRTAKGGAGGAAASGPRSAQWQGPAPGSRGFVSLPQDPVRHRVLDLREFVMVKGGAYFFLPGRDALRYLASL